DVLAFAGRFVDGDFLNEEVFRSLLDDSADAGEVAGEVGELHAAMIGDDSLLFDRVPLAGDRSWQRAGRGEHSHDFIDNRLRLCQSSGTDVATGEPARFGTDEAIADVR